MPHDLIDDHHRASDPDVRNRSLDGLLPQAPTPPRCSRRAGELDRFRRESENLYERVRAIFFLARHLPLPPAGQAAGRAARRWCRYDGLRRISWTGGSRRRSTSSWRSRQRQGPSDAIASALAAAYQALGFQTLADQVRRSVRSVRGNQWMFRMGHPADHPLGIRPAAETSRVARTSPFPILVERTPVRMDLSHSGWSDIFFLGMDFPEGARVLNVSVDLGVRGRDAAAAAADRGLAARDRRAGAAADERRPEVQGRRDRRWPTCSISPRTTWDCSRPP